VNEPSTKGFLGAFGRFLFSPTDPTTIGFMRIMTGLLLLYVHSAYSLDLKSFFGPDAWWGQEAANAQRREAGYYPRPLGWREFTPTVWFEEVPHRRGAMIEFMRNLPLDPEARRVKVKYLHRLATMAPSGDARSNQVFNSGLHLSNSAALLIEKDQDEKVRKALASPTIPEEGVPITFPQFVHDLPPQERLAVWEEVLAFNSALPPDVDKREYILNWLGFYPGHRRMVLYKFLAGELVVDGRNMSLPSDARERTEFLDYLEKWGADTRQATSKGVNVFSQWYHITDGTTMWAVHIAGLVVFLLFTVGLWTRVTSVLAWAVSLSYIHRGQLTLFGQDTMQTILVTYLMIAPSGAALSLDALRLRYRAAKALMRGGRSVPWAESALAGPQPHWLANFAIRLFQINFCLIYMSAGVSKLKGQTWWEHSAAWLIVANPEFGLIRYRAYEWTLEVLSEYRFVVALMAGFISLYTLVLELSLPFLVWTRLRPLVVVMSTLLHLGIAVMMGLTVFGLYMFTLLLCYFPAKLIRDRVAWPPGSGREMTVRYDSRNPAAVRKAALVRALDVTGQVTFVDTAGKGDVDSTIHMLDPDGQQRTGQDLYRTGLRELVLLRPVRFLGLVPGVWQAVNGWFGR
jgi:hypothetical protein